MCIEPILRKLSKSRTVKLNFITFESHIWDPICKPTLLVSEVRHLTRRCKEAAFHKRWTVSTLYGTLCLISRLWRLVLVRKPAACPKDWLIWPHGCFSQQQSLHKYKGALLPGQGLQASSPEFLLRITATLHFFCHKGASFTDCYRKCNESPHNTCSTLKYSIKFAVLSTTKMSPCQTQYFNRTQSSFDHSYIAGAIRSWACNYQLLLKKATFYKDLSTFLVGEPALPQLMLPICSHSCLSIIWRQFVFSR